MKIRAILISFMAIMMITLSASTVSVAGGDRVRQHLYESMQKQQIRIEQLRKSLRELRRIQDMRKPIVIPDNVRIKRRKK